MNCKNLGTIWLTAAVLLATTLAPARAQTDDTAAAKSNAQTLITILPKKSSEVLPTVNTTNVAVKVDGKNAMSSSLSHFGRGSTNLQLVLLIDDSARSSLGLYFKEMTDFLTALPPNTAVSVAYIENGSAHFLLPFTTDHAAAARTLHLTSSPPGANADPYFALTSLVQGWPGGTAENRATMRREVIMISDGVDPYYGLRYDPSNPYVTKATNEAQKHGVVVYSIYYQDRGRVDRLGAAINSGQNYLIQLSEATGGELYYQGLSNPVSFAPFFEEISQQLMNQYELGVNVPANVKDGLRSLKVKVNAPNTKTTSPAQIFVGDPAETK